MIIQSTGITTLVLLFLRGGPGMPVVCRNAPNPTGLEQDLTAVWWEQRGAGMSYNPDIPPQSMADGPALD